MLNTAASLRQSFVAREAFDPTNEKHLESLDVFLRTGNWGDVQFYHELPFIEVPITVLMKYVRHVRNIQVETPDEQAIRLAAKQLVKVRRTETSEQRSERLAKASSMIKGK